VFEEYVRFMKRFPDVRFITASEAARLYRDRAQGRRFSLAEIKAIASGVGDEVLFQKHAGYALSAGEVFALLNDLVAARAGGQTPDHLELSASPLGPTGRVPVLTGTVTTDASQLLRTSVDVADYLRKHHRLPSAVWLGSTPVPPEAYLRTLARVVPVLQGGQDMPATIEVRPARLGVARYVSADDPRLWGWVIFPPNFRAPALMDLARRQSWTLKPALPDRSAE
jgi:hypothetical protein